MVVQELCRQLPMIDFQNMPQLLAVGVPGANAVHVSSHALLATPLVGKQEPAYCSPAMSSCLKVISLPRLTLMRNAGVRAASGPATGLAGAAGLANSPQPPGRSALLYDMHTGAPRLHLVTAHDLDSTGSGARRSVNAGPASRSR